MITIKTGYATCRIEDGILPFAATNAISEACSYEVQGHEFMTGKKTWGGPRGYQRGGGKFANWDGMKRLYHKGRRTFPTGLLHKVMNILETQNVEFEIVPTDRIASREILGFRTDLNDFEVRTYQDEAVNAILEAGRCMVKVATGGGKTYIAARVISAISEPTCFLVHTKDLMYQAHGVFCKIFGKDRVGMIGDGHCESNDITICTIQTAAVALGVEYEKYSYAEDDDAAEAALAESKYGAVLKMLEEASIVIMDECHRVAAPTATNVVSAIKNAPWRIGLSASPWRDDGADLVLEAVFGHTAVDVNASSLIDAGHLVGPIIRFADVPPMTFPKGTKYSTIYEQYIVSNEVRNEIGVVRAIKMVKQGKQTMVLVRHIKHGEHIQNMLEDRLGVDVPFLSGRDDSELRNSVIQAMRDNKLPLLVATTIADEGLDIKPLQGLVLLGGGKSSTRALQRIGRVLRTWPGKTHAEVVDFNDQARFLSNHTATRLKIYESEPSFTVLDI